MHPPRAIFRPPSPPSPPLLPYTTTTTTFLTTLIFALILLTLLLPTIIFIQTSTILTPSLQLLPCNKVTSRLLPTRSTLRTSFFRLPFYIHTCTGPHVPFIPYTRRADVTHQCHVNFHVFSKLFGFTKPYRASLGGLATSFTTASAIWLWCFR